MTHSLSLKEYVRRKAQEQEEYVRRKAQEQDMSVSETIEKFQDTAFRQLADEIVILKDKLVKNKQEARTEASMYKEAIEEQKKVITELRQSLEATNARISELDGRVRQEADANQQRYIKLKKKEA
jgi:homoserine dehydrogenase